MGSKKVTYEQISDYINGEDGNGCILLTTEEEFEEEKAKQDKSNSAVKLKIQCKCGNEFLVNYTTFIGKNQKQCKECSNNALHLRQRTPIKKVYELTKTKGYEFIEWIDEYKNNLSRFIIKCEHGHLWNTCYQNLKRSDCSKCANKLISVSLRKNIDEIIQFIQNDLRQYKLICGLDEYENNKSKLTFECPNNHIFKMSWGAYRNGDYCSECTKIHLSNIHKGKGNPQWIDGRSSITEFLRANIKFWKKDSIRFNNYKCCITSLSVKSQIHHLTPFSKIINEILKELNITDVKDNINNYTEDELNKIIELNLKLHYKYGLGVTLTKSIHKLFHKLYGNRNNTPQQFKEFVTRLEKGEFSDFLKENNLELNINYEVLNKLIS